MQYDGFKKIPVSCEPAYAWLWNTEITREGISRQIGEMYDAGIRAFYVLAEPEEFRPGIRSTHLRPPYLSDEYLDLVYYAFRIAKEKGMYCWLYNEGGFPSGSACGQIRAALPRLARKLIGSQTAYIEAGTRYSLPEGCLAAFSGTERLYDGVSFTERRAVTEYYCADDERHPLLADNADRRVTDEFIRRTHEALYSRFGGSMGSDLSLMFDDEAAMGSWTAGLDRLFEEKYGYDIKDYMPFAAGNAEPETDAQYRAKSDYAMLCGELLSDNYFAPMRRWLNERGMRSAGHLNNDDRADAPEFMRYGNMMRMLRQFDVPGIDAIRGQISYAERSTAGLPFFPRLASSAARQQGHNLCLSESFAIYGAELTAEEMRCAVNSQAVRGISLFNFMAVSYARDGALCMQFRPNYIKEYPGMDCLRQINEYTGRLSYIMQTCTADIRTALYYPQRTVCAGGERGQRACAEYAALGAQLEERGVDFDIIDEEFVENAALEGGVLKGDRVSYENVIVPKADMEPLTIIQKLEGAGKTPLPCVERNNARIMARRLTFPDGGDGYFICNTGEETAADEIVIRSCLYPCGLDLITGKTYAIPYTANGGRITLPLRLTRGDGVMILLKNEPAAEKTHEKDRIILREFDARITRRTVIDPQRGIVNTRESTPTGAGEWDAAFSGEVTYAATLSGLPDGGRILDLGEVRHTAKVYLNGKRVGERIMPPYRLPLDGAKNGDRLEIVVANTLANACANTEFFSVQKPEDVGPYHEMMTEREALAPAGGLIGPVGIIITEEIR